MQRETLTSSMVGGPSRLERMLALRTFPGFVNVPTETLAAVAQNCRERRFRSGDHLFHEAQPVTRFHFVVSGEVEMRRDGRVFRTLGERSTAGALAAFAHHAHGHDAVATMDTVTLEIPVEVMLEIFEDDFDVLRNVLRALSAEALEARRKLGAHAGFSNVVAKQPAVSARPLDLVQRMAAIRSTMPFVESHLDAIADLAQEARELRAPPGHVLWRPGEQALDLLVVVAGEIECVSAERDQAFRLGPGDAAGSLGAMASLHRWYEARVTESLVALSLPVEAVFDVFEDHFEMALDMIGGLASVVLRLYEDAAADGGA